MLPNRRDARERSPQTVADPSIATRELDCGASVPGPVPTHAPQIGDRLDDQYQIRAVLGSGGMGTVYLAHDEQLDRDVAIKLVHSDLLGKDPRVDGFLEEARAMARVRHPNVVTIYAFGARHGHPYFAMEYIHGENLSVWRRRHPLLPPRDAVQVLDSLAQGVQGIHDAGAIHRDLKPGNVLVGVDQRIAVTDFGLARSVRRDLVAERIPLSGTPAYIAPEIARSELLGPELITRIDIYALGVIAFELLTGELPFIGESLTELLDQHAYAPPPRPSDVRPKLPKAFDAPLSRALAKNPADRPASAEELRLVLREALSATEDDRAPLRVMVVDDEVNTLVATRELLMMSFPGVEVVTVADAASAEAIARRESFDLIITDLNMPHGGGMALTSALRANPSTTHTPIIVVTAYGGASDWQQLRGMGADRFLVKPVEFDMLVGQIRSLTGRAQ